MWVPPGRQYVWRAASSRVKVRYGADKLPPSDVLQVTANKPLAASYQTAILIPNSRLQTALRVYAMLF